jgi:hypothetical protein
VKDKKRLVDLEAWAGDCADECPVDHISPPEDPPGRLFECMFDGLELVRRRAPPRGACVTALRIRKLARHKTHRAGLSGSNQNMQLTLRQQRWAERLNSDAVSEPTKGAVGCCDRRVTATTGTIPRHAVTVPPSHRWRSPPRVG